MGNSASNLPYTITSKDEEHQRTISQSKSGPMKHWIQREGTSKDSAATPVSIFISTCVANADEAPSADERCKSSIVSHFYQHSKKLVHPSLVRVIAAEEVEEAAKQSYFSKAAPPNKTCYIVTEPVEPLTSSKLASMNDNDKIYGLHCIVQGLVFLHSNNLALGEFSMESVFVNKSGEWKLFDYSFITEISMPDAFNNRLPNDNFVQNYRFFSSLFPPEVSINAAKYERSDGVHVMDAYNLGIFIEKVFNNAVPQKLVKAKDRLKADKPKLRPRLPGLLNCPVFQNDYLKMNLFLNDFMLKEEEDKLNFIRDELDFRKVPEKCAKFKILPIIENTVVAGIERNLIIVMIPKIFELCEVKVSSKTEFKELRFPAIILKLFEMSDRAVRANLLGRLSFLVSLEYLESREVGRLFDSVCSGFSDTHNQMREMTLKNMLHLLPILDPSKIEKLLRYLIKLSGDEEDSIRVNSAIFISKICDYLTTVQITKFVIPMLNKLTNDNFVPAKLQSLITYRKLSTKLEADDEVIATKVIPAISLKLVDTELQIQREAFAIIRDYISILEQKLPDEDTVPLTSAPSVNSFMSATFTQNSAPNSGNAIGIRSMEIASKKEEPSLSALGWSDDEFDDNKDAGVQKLSLNDDDMGGWDDF